MASREEKTSPFWNGWYRLPTTPTAVVSPNAVVFTTANLFLIGNNDGLSLPGTK